MGSAPMHWKRHARLRRLRVFSSFTGATAALAFPHLATISAVYRLRPPWLAQDWFDINDRSTIDCFDRTDSQAILADLAHRYFMKPNGIGPIRRASCEDASQ